MQFEVQTVDALTGAMREHAQACFPNEACGLIVSAGKKAHFVACKNQAPDPQANFLIGPDDYIKATEQGEVIAIWHSHTHGSVEPSEADLGGCEMWQLPWLISGVESNGQTFTHQGPNLIKPKAWQADYVGRPYVFGSFDCYSLLTDFYAREFGIQLGRYPNLRVSQWWRKDMDILGDHWREQGFVPVTDGTFKHGDALGIAMDSEVANHVAVYVTGDIILHHLVNRLSRREPFSPYWLSRVKLHLRHRTKC